MLDMLSFLWPIQVVATMHSIMGISPPLLQALADSICPPPFVSQTVIVVGAWGTDGAFLPQLSQ